MKPRLLDLFCGAGMASEGYQRAGWETVGVDINPQPDYPGLFLRGDALAVLNSDLPGSFDAIHASPPCQAHTRAKHLRTAQGGEAKYPDLLTPTLALLTISDDVNRIAEAPLWPTIPWVVENVPGAPGMGGAVTCCGSSFGLGVRRHRLFLSNEALRGTVCDHKAQGRPWGVYHVPHDDIPQGGRTARNVEHGREVMGVTRPIPWASLKEGFPPAYTEHIGRQLMEGMT